MGTAVKAVRVAQPSPHFTARTPQQENYMSKGSLFLFAVAGCLLLAQPLMAQEGINGNLVTVDWLQNNLNNANVLILDASPGPMHAAQHIPGAVNVDLLTYGVHEIPISDTEKRFQSWGISPGKKIVLYDQGASIMATRLFFDLVYHGFPASGLYVLDGGLSKWQADGGSVTKESTPSPKKGTFHITKFREDVRVKLPEFLNASGDPGNNVLLEALGANWHFGEVHPFDRAGHIPNGILLPSEDFYNEDKTFKSVEEIKKMLAYVGAKPEQQIHTYCGGGVAASVPWFAARFILNYPKVKLYEESEMGWLLDERDLPYWTYDAPNLMRETDWLKSWGCNRMMRMYGVSQVSIVDVRPAEEFNQGHVPFALNIPAEVFKANLNNPEKLAEILGPAGVNASHEAIIVSGAGLTKVSALAFVALEILGQKKVSIFVDPFDKWTQPGTALTRDTTVVGPKKAFGEVSIPPMTYPVNIRKDVIITDPKSTHGLYPKVFIASGMNVPVKAQEGKIVHVPYTDLLNADGTPKDAKDIWNILVKAGITRYAELVCFSDDPGEAAVNYFILKLMGYPDVKVLLM